MSSAVLFLMCYSLIFLMTYFSNIKEMKENKPKKLSNRSQAGFYITLFAIFIVQIISTQFSIGYTNDTGLFTSWASFGKDHHIWEYYTTDKYVDYPPVYLCVLFIMGKIASFFGVNPEQTLYYCFVRFVPILFDLLSSIVVFGIAKEKLGDKIAVSLALLSAINPINIFNSTVWGQIDSVVSLMISGVLLFLYKKKYVAATALFILSFLTKPQMIIYAPVFGFTILFDFIEIIKDKEERKKMLKALLLSFGAALAVLLIAPLAVTGGRYMLLLDKFKSALRMYQYATVCAANFFGALGGNWVKNTEPFLFLNYKTWGFIFIVTMSLLVGYVSYKVKDRTKIFYMGAFTVSTIYMFAHGMHERYLFPLFLMLLIIFIMKKDPKVLFVYLLFSMSNLINCVQTLIKNHEKDFIYADNTLFIINSWINIAIYVFMVYIFYVALFKKKEKLLPLTNVKKEKEVIKTEKADVFRFQGAYEKVQFVKWDYLIMAGLTIIYSVFAFFSLGSKDVPQQGWYPEAADESVIFDLGENCDIRRIYTHCGWIDRHAESRDIERNLTIEISDDGERYALLDEKITLDKVFTWKVTELTENARFIRITPDDNRFYLNEISFFGETEAEKFIPAAVISQNETAQMLTDEQEKVRYEFSWYDNTYFDEIYHPRTAYEYIHDLHPYENTHPPLGKIIISWGIMLFGMNPFGWRFFGTLCGVLMVPLAYLMGKTMFKKTSWACLTTVIFSFDFMHLSQTRLATIDSFTAFFVMGMYYFMYHYISRSFYNEGLKKTLLPLFLSGVFFGLGSATKWQGIYAGAGLAVIYFITLYKRYKEYKEAEKILNTNNTKDDLKKYIFMVEKFKSYSIKTILCGFLFFVFIPFIIYFVSYIPTMNNENEGISYFFTNQNTMFSYHSSIEGTHSFMSRWWTWPLDLRPLYMYAPNRMFIPEGTSMGITTFGNPLVWWLTIPVVVGALYMLVYTYLSKKQNAELKIMATGYLAMFLPWILVSRSSFIYHFFPCVIFVVLMIVYFMKMWYEKNPKPARAVAIVSYAVLVTILFVLFYPVLTGIPVPQSYAKALVWMPTWVLG